MQVSHGKHRALIRHLPAVFAYRPKTNRHPSTRHRSAQLLIAKEKGRPPLTGRPPIKAHGAARPAAHRRLLRRRRLPAAKPSRLPSRLPFLYAQAAKPAMTPTAIRVSIISSPCWFELFRSAGSCPPGCRLSRSHLQVWFNPSSPSAGPVAAMAVAVIAHRAAPAGAIVEFARVERVEIFADQGEQPSHVILASSWILVELDLRLFCFD
jgi:hypothetical protein